MSEVEISINALKEEQQSRYVTTSDQITHTQKETL